MTRILTLWGKTDELSNETHPLLYHMLDAGYVSSALWNDALPAQLKRDMAGSLGLAVEPTGRLIAFWSSLHDLGKAGPAFQIKHLPSQTILVREGFPFPQKAFFTPKPHGLVTSWALANENLLPGLDAEQSEMVGRVLGGHHGLWPDGDTFEDVGRTANLGGPIWQEARKELVEILSSVFAPPDEFQFPTEDLDRNIFMTLLSGLVSVSDWLASMQSMFPAAGHQNGWQMYVDLSADRAKKAVAGQGWLLWNDPTGGEPLSFAQLFPDNPNPRPVQAAVLEKASDVTLPAMALIEAPTGIGKTEIAFALADRWLRQNQGRGIYIAMPTQATSNQMYNRTSNFLVRRYDGETVHVQLAHSHAMLQEQFERKIVFSVGEDPIEGVMAAGWFLPRKRTLLAPFGVGTVDQVFLSILQARHFFVRLFGLYGKVLIFDEIHAYDAYQSELFTRLLTWLRALKVSVILLSATLPAQARSQMIRAYGGTIHMQQPMSYPCLTVVNENGAEISPLPESPSVPLELDRVGSEPSDVAEYLKENLADGGCAAVICNTVSKAQSIFRAIKAAGVAPDHTFLFHARFPFSWRDEIEKQVLGAFGPGEDSRPQRAVVVATQVIEQSLDLDFDLMVSEMAPVDLLIQRAGRLHRHQRGYRPPHLCTRRLALVDTQQTQEGDPDFGPSSFVYREYHLLRTQAVLKGRSNLLLPGETQTLIEAVYGDRDLTAEDPQIAALLPLAMRKMKKAIDDSVLEAKKRLIPLPHQDDLLVRRSENLSEDEDPSAHPAWQALTREAPPGVRLVCLHFLEDGRLTLEPGDTETVIDITRKPSKDEIKKLLEHVVQVQRPEVVAYFSRQPVYPPWQEIPALRYHFPVTFSAGAFRFAALKLVLNLDREFGLSFLKEDQ